MSTTTPTPASTGPPPPPDSWPQPPRSSPSSSSAPAWCCGCWSGCPVGHRRACPSGHELWVTDLTFVPTFAGIAYVCFIVDAFSRMIVGWRVASHMRTEMVLDAIEMARWSRGTQFEGLRCPSDAGSQFTSLRYGERLAEIGAVPSIGTIGDSYDCEDEDGWLVG